MTTKELINQYVTAHADNRWMDASELEALLTEFAEEMRAKQVAVIKCEKKSPITGGEMQLMQEKSSAKFRGEEISFTKKFYHCVDSGQDFTDTELDNDNMWAIFRAYWERKGFEHFYDIDGYREGQKPASDDLEKEIDDYTNSNFSECEDGVLISDAYSMELTLLDVAPMARHFAQWQREQMMKDAIEGKVVAVRNTMSDKLHTYPWVELEAQLSKNDKVKVIIIKE